MSALQTTKQVGGTFVMLKKLIPNSDIVIEKCIDQTLDYLRLNPNDFTTQFTLRLQRTFYS